MWRVVLAQSLIIGPKLGVESQLAKESDFAGSEEYPTPRLSLDEHGPDMETDAILRCS